VKVAIVYNRPVVAGNEAALCSADVLSQVEAVRSSLLALGHEPVLFALSREDATRLPAALRAAGVACAVNLCEALDDDNRLQGHVAVLLELAGVPYTGSEMLALSLTTDKYLAKKALAAEAVPTPRFALYQGSRLDTSGLRFPLIVKPRYEDGSVGIEEDSVVEDTAGLESALTRLQARYGDVLIEEYIEGRELYAALLGYPQPQPLPVSEIDFSALGKKRWRIVGYRAKWVEENPEYAGTTRLFPTDPATEAVQAVALRCFRLFGCRDYARVDIRLSQGGTPYVLEVNANPCLSPESGYAAALQQAGIPYQEFVRRLLGYARRRADQWRADQ